MSTSTNIHNAVTFVCSDLNLAAGTCITFEASDKDGNSVCLFLNDDSLAKVVQACKAYAEKRAVPAVSYWEHLTTAVPAPDVAAPDYDAIPF